MIITEKNYTCEKCLKNTEKVTFELLSATLGEVYKGKGLCDKCIDERLKWAWSKHDFNRQFKRKFI